MEISWEEAQGQLEHLIELAATAEEVIILQEGIPAARLEAISPEADNDLAANPL